MKLFGLTVLSKGASKSDCLHCLWDHKAVKEGDGQTGVLCCLLKSNLNFYRFVSKQTTPEVQSVDLNRGAHVKAKKENAGPGKSRHKHALTFSPTHK